MSFFKKKILKEEFVQLIYEYSVNQFNLLNNEFKNEFDYKETLLYILTIITIGMLIKRYYYFHNIDLEFDITDELDKIIYDSIQDKDIQIVHIQYYVCLIDEEWEILKNDNAQMVYDIANYFINEITEEQNKDNLPRQYMANVITNWHFELKQFLKNLKL